MFRKNGWLTDFEIESIGKKLQRKRTLKLGLCSDTEVRPEERVIIDEVMEILRVNESKGKCFEKLMVIC